MTELTENTSPEEMEELRAIVRINGFLPDIRALTQRKVDMALTLADGKIDRHEMTPDEAYSVLHEIHAYRKVLKSFDIRGRMGKPNNG